MKLHVCPQCRKIHRPQALCPVCLGPLWLEPPEFLVGQVIEGYRLERILGSGVTGIVFLATREHPSARVAFKMLIPDESDDDAVRRFTREARLLGELKHPHVVTMYESGESAWGTPFFTMELIEGVSLRKMVAARGSGLPFDEALVHARQIAEGLQFAHGRGVIHRDLKPEHVIHVQTEAGAIDKLIDFGFAKQVLHDSGTRLTVDGLVLGTPAYLSPEQVRGGMLGPYTDQYAMALLVAELLTGRKMREKIGIASIVTEEVVRPLPADRLSGADLPEHVARVLARATEPDPAKRFPDVLAFVAALEAGDRQRPWWWRVFGRPG